MKRIIFTGLLLATMGTTGVSAKNLTVSEPGSTENVQCVTTKVTYSTCVVDGCTVKYKHTSYYLLGCIYLYTVTCEVSRTCGGGGGSENF